MPRDAGRALASTRVDRAGWVLILAGVASMFILARRLVPSPSGLGTHRQLGLPACGLLTWLGLPCPACGLTTAFAQLARMHPVAATAAHPMGVPLFVLGVALVPLALHGLACARSLRTCIDPARLAPWALGLFTTWFLSYCARLFGQLQR